MPRNRKSSINAYKNKLENLDDADLTNAREGSLLTMSGAGADTAVAGAKITISELEPDSGDGIDGDIWFVVAGGSP